MNYYQKKINELRSEIYEDIVEAMKSNGTTEIEFGDFDGPYFVGVYGDDLADYQITKLYKKEKGGLYAVAHSKWDMHEKTFCIRYDYGFQDLEVLNEILIAVTEALTELPPKKNIVVMGDYVEICNNNVVNVEIK